MPNIKKSLEERTRSRQLREIRRFLAQASSLEVQQIYFFAKGLELDAKVPGLTPEQKHALTAMQVGFVIGEEIDEMPESSL